MVPLPIPHMDSNFSLTFAGIFRISVERIRAAKNNNDRHVYKDAEATKSSSRPLS